MRFLADGPAILSPACPSSEQGGRAGQDRARKTQAGLVTPISPSEAQLRLRQELSRRDVPGELGHAGAIEFGIFGEQADALR